MHRTGLSERGLEDKGVRWVAVHHGGNHVHIASRCWPGWTGARSSCAATGTGSPRRCPGPRRSSG
jgi:hypothetical protein